MRGLLVLIVLVGVALWWGGQNFITGVREREPLEITCADYLKHRPDNRYLRLTQCEPDLDNFAYKQSKKGDIDQVYVPLRAKGGSGGKTQIVLLRSDDTITMLASKANRDTLDDALLAKVQKELEGSNEGLVQFGLDLSDKAMDELKKLNLGLADDFVILEHGKSPRLLLGGLVLAAGLLGLAFFVRGVIRKVRGSDA